MSTEKWPPACLRELCPPTRARALYLDSQAPVLTITDSRQQADSRGPGGERGPAEGRHHRRERAVPDGWAEAQRLLKARRLLHQGWYPMSYEPPNHKGETLAQLQAEQKKHPDLCYLKSRQAKSEGPDVADTEPADAEPAEPVKAKKALTAAEMREVQ